LTKTPKVQQLTSRGGRPRDPGIDVAISEAALDLLAEKGYEQLAIEAVAERSGSARATIYRRWKSKLELVIYALGTLPREIEDGLDTGSLRGDLALFSERLNRHREIEGRTLAILRGLAAALPQDPKLFAAVNEHFIAPRLAGLRAMLERAVARGEISEDSDVDMLASIIPAFVLHRMFVEGTASDPAYMARVIDIVLIPAATAAPSPSTSRRAPHGDDRTPL
jgi:AcrR family transcriptional regulator